MAKKNQFRYFYLNNELHRVLSINKRQDLCTCWNYPQRKRVGYIYSDLIRKRQNAISRADLAKYLNRHVDRVKRAMREGKIAKPQQAYSLDGYWRPLGYFFSERDAMDAYDYFSNVHVGRPRKDGKSTNNTITPLAEFRALVAGSRVLYTKVDGEEVPVFI